VEHCLLAAVGEAMTWPQVELEWRACSLALGAAHDMVASSLRADPEARAHAWGD